MSPSIAFDNTFARLPERFYERRGPTPVAAPRLLALNHALAAELGVDEVWLGSEEGVAVLAGNAVPDGAAPMALAYAGHQFGHFVPQLGDGRALLLGEVVGRDGARRDLQLKGSGPTRFSRGGDGRAAVGPVLREYLVSEAMHALGVPTTRSLAAVATGEPVYREQVLPGAVLARVAASHVRVGTFQYLAARGDVEGLELLAEHVIDRHDPSARAAPHPGRALLEGVVARQAELVARWLHVGFVHGVMNTDNTAISGETIDYGPCAFVDAYDPATVFSSIDRQGRYAFGNQPAIAQWNLARLAEAMLPLLGGGEEESVAAARAALQTFAPTFERAYLAGMRRKLGLRGEREGDGELVDDLLALMTRASADYTLTFRDLAGAALSSAGVDAWLAHFVGDAAARGEAAQWASRWAARLAHDEREGPTPLGPEARAAALRAVNPRYTPRNHRVEQALRAAIDDGDLRPFEALLAVVTRPFDEHPGHEHLAAPPHPEERVLRTFCGT